MTRHYALEKVRAAEYFGARLGRCFELVYSPWFLDE